MKSEEIIKDKEGMIQLLEELYDALLDATIIYKKLQSELWLNTDFTEVLDKGRPTVDEKKAYITLQSLAEKERKDYYYNKIQILKLKLELCDDKLKCCEDE